MSIHDKINSGYYDAPPAKLRPSRPPILKKAVEDLTDDEVNSIIPIRDAYNKELKEWKESKSQQGKTP